LSAFGADRRAGDIRAVTSTLKRAFRW
jgi:hypothetical protein